MQVPRLPFARIRVARDDLNFQLVDSDEKSGFSTRPLRKESRSFTPLNHPSDEDLSLGTPESRSVQDDKESKNACPSIRGSGRSG
jgi:hypothetical protein